MADSILYGNLEKKDLNNDHSFQDLVRFIERGFGGKDRTNKADVVRSMESEPKISGLLKKYNKVLKMILQIIYESKDNFPKSWYYYNAADINVIWHELNAFLNTQIKRVFDEKEYTDKLALECIVNLRGAKNKDIISNYIISKSTEDVKSKEKEIVECTKIVREAPHYMNDVDSINYKEHMPKYIKSIKYLIKNGYHKDFRDASFESQANIYYFESIKTLVFPLLSIIAILVVYGSLIWLLRDVSIFTIIVLIGLPGALISYLK